MNIWMNKCCFARNMQWFWPKVMHLSSLPSNKGLIFLQQVMPPWLVYWPRAVSRKKTGTPQANRKMRYGMRNAPELREDRGLRISLQGHSNTLEIVNHLCLGVT